MRCCRNVTKILTLFLLLFFCTPVMAADQLMDMQVLDVQTLKLGSGQSVQATLKGRPAEQSSIYMQDLMLTVTADGQQPTVFSLPAEFNGGYDSTLEAADFTGDKRDEIVVSMATGGSGGVVNYLIYTYKQHKWQLIYSPIYPGEVKMTGKYLDGYKVQVNLQGIKKPIILTLKDRKSYLDEAHIYQQGKLIGEAEPWMNFDIMEIVDSNRDGIKEVRAHYTINGICNADDIASVWANWRYENGRWQRHGITVNIIK